MEFGTVHVGIVN